MTLKLKYTVYIVV